MSGSRLDELAPEQLDQSWLRGGFPRAFLAEDMAARRTWRESFIRTYLERDLPQLGINLPALTLRRFWVMLGHYHAQTWNGSELARALGVSDKTVSRVYLADTACCTACWEFPASRIYWCTQNAARLGKDLPCGKSSNRPVRGVM